MASEPRTDGQTQAGLLSQGRRAASRLRMSSPGIFLGVHGNQNCIVTNLSQTGVLIALAEPFEIGDEGYLRSGPIDHFMTVTRKDHGLNALEFDNPVSHDFVVQMRHSQEMLAEHLGYDLPYMAHGTDPDRARKRI